MKKSVLLALILIAFNGQAQFKNLSLRVAATYPVINNVTERADLNVVPISPSSGYSTTWVRVGSIRQSFDGKVGIDISGRFNYFVSERFFLSSGISATCTRYQRNVNVESINEISQPTVALPATTPGVTIGSMFGTITLRDVNGDPINHVASIIQSPDLGNSTLWNMQVPLLAGTTFFRNRLYVKAGPVFSYLLYASEVRQRYDLRTTSISDYKDTSKDGFNEFSTSGILETTFQATKRFGVDLTAQHFFTSLYSTNDSPESKVRCNNFTIGVSYTL